MYGIFYLVYKVYIRYINDLIFWIFDCICKLYFLYWYIFLYGYFDISILIYVMVLDFFGMVMCIEVCFSELILGI